MISETVYDAAKKLYVSNRGWLITAALHIPIIPFIALIVLGDVVSPRRRVALLMGIPMLTSARLRHRLVRTARYWMQLNGTIRATEMYWLVLARYVEHEEATKVLFSCEANRLVAEHEHNPNLTIARGIAAYESGHFRQALENFEMTLERESDAYMSTGVGLTAAHSAGMMRRSQSAIENLSRYYDFMPRQGEHSPEAVRDAFFRQALQRTLTSLLPHLNAEELKDETQRCGIFYLSSTEALGHAILDPYHFLALTRGKYDRVFFLGPARSSYRAASATCLSIVECYGDYVEVTDDALLNLSWMSLGTFTFEPIELVIENYWGLLRTVTHRSRDTQDTFEHNRWHMTCPDLLVPQGERFCQRHHIDLDRPIVILHARHSGYHGLTKQAFRDSHIVNYKPAIEFLLSNGFQVMRIGDRAMPRMPVKHRDYFEIPFLEGYDTAIDPFLVARSAFMIGCQSGPCAYARVFGVPILSINAVLHYSLLPGRMEMACFKRYVRTADDGRLCYVSPTEALDADLERLDSSIRFKQAGIDLHESSPEEILAAVQDMLAWLDNPELAETEHQISFRYAVERKMRQCARRAESLDLPIADYVGIALPGYRLSPTVARMRAGDGSSTIGKKDAA